MLYARCLIVMLQAISIALSLSSEVFSSEGRNILGSVRCYSTETENRRFRSLFGVSPSLCSELWSLLIPDLPSSALPKHLLWALMFLKIYASEHVNCVLSGADEKTFRKWCWLFVDLLSRLHLIKWSNRLEIRTGMVYKSSVDGVDFEIQEPSPFSTSWFSHKFNCPGLRYEIAIGIGSGNICWASGTFPCGSHSDLKIFRLRLKGLLGKHEKIIADGGYRDERYSYGTPEYMNGGCGFIRARHEVINKRLKQFLVLGRRFRHPLRRHASCFFAVANIKYLLIENGETIFKV